MWLSFIPLGCLKGVGKSGGMVAQTIGFILLRDSGNSRSL